MSFNQTKIKSICAHCGANSGNYPVYIEAAAAVSDFIASRRLRLAYGGGEVGMMGTVANQVIKCGGKATGIIPDFPLGVEFGHNQLNELIVVNSMRERKTKMFEMSDAFLALLGGMGTLKEKNCAKFLLVRNWRSNTNLSDARAACNRSQSCLHKDIFYLAGQFSA